MLGVNTCGNYLSTKQTSMSNTYTQISIHTIFAVKGRQSIIAPDWRDSLHSYIAGIITDEGAFSLAVGGWKDHVHAFFGLQPTLSISEIMKKIKAGSSGWVNREGLVDGKFQWQSGYGAFSYSKSQRDSVIKYIINQEEHHRKESFREEYLRMLNNFEVSYNEKYLFEFYD